MSQQASERPLDVQEPTQRVAAQSSVRPFLQVFFRCANVYTRVYRNASGDAYNARCSKCGKVVNFKVGEGGTSVRAFEVNCRS